MGVAVHPEVYRPLSVTDKKLWRRLWKEDDPVELVEEVWQALREGFPGTTAEAGQQELLGSRRRRSTEYALEIARHGLHGSLGREVLLNVLPPTAPEAVTGRGSTCCRRSKSQFLDIAAAAQREGAIWVTAAPPARSRCES